MVQFSKMCKYLLLLSLLYFIVVLVLVSVDKTQDKKNKLIVNDLIPEAMYSPAVLTLFQK